MTELENSAIKVYTCNHIAFIGVPLCYEHACNHHNWQSSHVVVVHQQKSLVMVNHCNVMITFKCVCSSIGNAYCTDIFLYLCVCRKMVSSLSVHDYKHMTNLRLLKPATTGISGFGVRVL